MAERPSLFNGPSHQAKSLTTLQDKAKLLR